VITTKLIEGLTILEKYRDKPNGYNIGAEHGCIYGFATDRPLSDLDLARIVELGWFQDVDLGDDEETECDFGLEDYDPSKSWCYCTLRIH
jgi:hypothetical protein